MERKEHIFTDIAGMVLEKELISRNISDDTWLAADYESEKYSGTMILTTAKSKAPSVTIPLGLHGWHRIYVGFISIGSMYTYLQLDSDISYSGLSPSTEGNVWAHYETIHEVMWKCAELNGDKLTISHPDCYATHNSGLVWVRCVEMNDEDIAEYEKEKNTPAKYKVHAHIDTDFTGHDRSNTVNDTLCKIQALKGTDVTMLSQEISFDACEYPDEETGPNYVGIFGHDRKRNDVFCEFNKIKDKSYAKMVEYCESIGIRIHATFRMQMSSFKFPVTYPNFQMKFADEHPEYYIKTRDGRDVSILSYAYPEVRDKVIEIFVDAYRKGFPAITLLWIRGICIGFEEPVLQRVAEKYDGLDARTLPMTDERLNSVWCEFITEFARKLRKTLDNEAVKLNRPRCNIHSFGFYSTELSKQMGVDIEAWAKEGLIDGLTVGMYSHYEVLDEILADDGSGLIDLEKYKVVSRSKYMVRRIHWMKMDMMLNAIEEHEKLAEKYGIETYYSVDWEGRQPSLYADQAKEFYAKGAKGICLWDTNNRVSYTPGWHVTSKLGHEEYCNSEFVNQKYASYRNIYKVLRLNDHDLSYVNVNWRG
ncbi:MAG: hypothetical protein J6Q78_03105 [Clostridia bacterium]|nr:hypothetical protein [Clostridia bacterium]